MVLSDELMRVRAELNRCAAASIKAYASSQPEQQASMSLAAGIPGGFDGREKSRQMQEHKTEVSSCER